MIRRCVYPLFLLLALFVSAEPSVWTTVYHDDEVTIELRADYVTYGSDGMPQVQFRWTFATSRALKLTPGISYKSRVETTAIDIEKHRFRTLTAKLYDSTGAEIHFDAVVPSHGWDEITSDSLMAGIFPHAKKLIESKAR